MPVRALALRVNSHPRHKMVCSPGFWQDEVALHTINDNEVAAIVPHPARQPANLVTIFDDYGITLGGCHDCVYG